jgi:hypothetical protein
MKDETEGGAALAWSAEVSTPRGHGVTRGSGGASPSRFAQSRTGWWLKKSPHPGPLPEYRVPGEGAGMARRARGEFAFHRLRFVLYPPA